MSTACNTQHHARRQIIMEIIKLLRINDQDRLQHPCNLLTISEAGRHGNHPPALRPAPRS